MLILYFLSAGFLNWALTKISKLGILTVSLMSSCIWIDIITIASLTCPVWTDCALLKELYSLSVSSHGLIGMPYHRKDFRCILEMFFSCPKMTDFRSAGHWRRKAPEVVTSRRVSCLTLLPGLQNKRGNYLIDSSAFLFLPLPLWILQGIWELLFLPIWKSNSK